MAQQTDATVEARIGRNKYGDTYEYYECMGCGIEAAAQWQVEQACECGDA